jgi:hypothetical protein
MSPRRDPDVLAQGADVLILTERALQPVRRPGGFDWTCGPGDPFLIGDGGRQPTAARHATAAPGFCYAPQNPSALNWSSRRGRGGRLAPWVWAFLGGALAWAVVYALVRAVFL